MVKDFQFEGHDRGGKIVRAYNTEEVDTLIADLGQNPEKTLTVSPSGGDYTSIQSALDACTGTGWTILVYPGTYTESLTFNQNQTSVIGMVSAGGTQGITVTNSNADVVDFGNTNGCIITRVNISLTNAASEVFAVKKGTTGTARVRFCKVSATCTTGGINAGIGYSEGGTLSFNYGRCYFTNNVVGGLGSRKAAFRVSPAGGSVILQNLQTIDVNTDGICGVSCICADGGGIGTIGMDKCISVEIDDDDATHTTAFYLTGSSNNEYIYNSIHVNRYTNNPNNGYIVYSPGGTSTHRFSYNHLHVVQNTGTAYSFNIDTNVDVTSHFDDIIATVGESGDGTYTYVNSPANGDIQISGSYFNMYGQAVTVGSRGGDYTTIQDAIDGITDASASNRYTVLVYPGTYTENVVMAPYISLRSISGKSDTEITSSTGTTLTMDTTASARVDGFKITTTGGKCLSVPAGGAGKNFTFENSSFRVIINNTYTNGIELSSGKCNFVNCKFDYSHTGTGGGTHRCFYLDSIDELLFLTCELIMDVSDSAQADDVEVVGETNTTIPTYFWSSGFTCNRGGVVTGETTIYSADGDSSNKYFGACYLYFNNNGSGGTAQAIKTGNNGCTILSQANVVTITNFTTNYSFNVDTNDTLYTNFDSITCADDETGAGTFESIHAVLPGGDLHVTRDIILGRNIEIGGVAGFTAGTTINEFSTDGTLAGDSDDAVPTEKAVKTYVDTELGDYVLKDGSVAFTGTVGGITPVDNSDLATKSYVDAIAAGGGTGDLGPVVDKDLVTSPVGVVGNKYIIAGTGGNWAAGAVDDIAECTGTGPETWSFTTPDAGDYAWVSDESRQYTFTGVSWVTTGSILSHLSLQDIGTNTHVQIDSHIADTTNPHVVTKAQLSLDNVTNDAQLKRSANDWNGFGEKTSVVNNDRFIIEDSGDGLAKKYVIGNNMIDQKVKISSNDTTQDYLSNKLIGTTDKITLTEINDGGDEDYQVNTGDDIMDVTVAGQIAGMTEKTAPVDADMVMINDSEDTNNPKMVQRSNLLPIFGTQYQETSSDAQSTTTSSTYVQKLRMTTANLPSGTYRIGFYCETGQTTAGDDVEWQVELNDTTVIGEGSDGPATFVGDTGDRLSHGGFYNTSLSGINTIDIDYRQAGGGTAIIRRARIELWRVS